MNAIADRPASGPAREGGGGAIRRWIGERVARLREEARSARDTPMLRLDPPAHPRAAIFLKDETGHASGSLKHRLARSLFLYALCNHELLPGCPALDASSGSTAISEAWFARLLEVPYIAVLPSGTAPDKLAELEALGAKVELVADATQVYARAAELACERQGCYLDQFTHAERATDWRGNNNIAESMIGDLERAGIAEPAWFVCGAGTGGTLATTGRYFRYQGLGTRLLLADPPGSVLMAAWQGTAARGDRERSLIEGIGRPRVEPSFLPRLVDAALRVPDEASIAGCLFLERLTGRRFGGSSGTHFVACLALIAARAEGAILSVLGDGGERYQRTLYDPGWRRAQRLDPEPWLAAIESLWRKGSWQPPTPLRPLFAEDRRGGNPSA